jgi:hypothetical protein
MVLIDQPHVRLGARGGPRVGGAGSRFRRPSASGSRLAPRINPRQPVESEPIARWRVD